MTDETRQPGIRVNQIILESAAFKHREDFLALPANTGLGEIGMTVDYEAGVSPEGDQGFVRIHVRSAADSNPAYVFGISMIALMEVDKGSANMPMEQFVAVNGGALLFPFVREAVANLTGRGRFGPLWLRPINLQPAFAGATKELPKASTSKASPRGGAKRAKRG